MRKASSNSWMFQILSQLNLYRCKCFLFFKTGFNDQLKTFAFHSEVYGNNHMTNVDPWSSAVTHSQRPAANCVKNKISSIAFCTVRLKNAIIHSLAIGVRNVFGASGLTLNKTFCSPNSTTDNFQRVCHASLDPLCSLVYGRAPKTHRATPSWNEFPPPPT